MRVAGIPVATAGGSHSHGHLHSRETGIASSDIGFGSCVASYCGCSDFGGGQIDHHSLHSRTICCLTSLDSLCIIHRQPKALPLFGTHSTNTFPMTIILQKRLRSHHCRLEQQDPLGFNDKTATIHYSLLGCQLRYWVFVVQKSQ